jgi:guanine deaminase
LTTTKRKLALRSATLSFDDDPYRVGEAAAMRYESDGLIMLEDGLITASGSYTALKDKCTDHELVHYPDALIVPGFIDTHVHYPQTQIIGSYGNQLIDWLNEYTFVAEQQFADTGHAERVSELFLQQCLRVGTTTAAVFCTVHSASVQAFFKTAHRHNMRMLAGKVLMDRNAPAALTDTAQSGYDDSEALIQQWHGRGRLSYAITPRFAPSSSPAQLEAAGALRQRYPQTYVQTHLSENPHEVDWVRELFPERQNYLDVYAHYGLTGPRCIFGHAIHLQEAEWQHLSESGSAIAHCPTSNAFLGSGLFDFARAKDPKSPVRLGLASDVGAGTTLSMLQTMGAAHKIGQLGHHPLSALKALYLATRGAAQALYLEDKVGSIAPGMEADLVVLNLKSTPLIEFRMQHCETIQEVLFVQMTMADDRATQAVYVGGTLAYTDDPR